MLKQLYSLLCVHFHPKNYIINTHLTRCFTIIWCSAWSIRINFLPSTFSI